MHALIDDAVLRLLDRWMPSTRWFPLKGQSVASQLVAEFPLPGAAASIALVRVGETLLHVPIAKREVAGAVTIAEHDGAFLVDALHDERAVRAILRVAAGAERVEGLSGEGAAPSPTHVRVIAGEQSNTSIIGEHPDSPCIAKVFRVVAPGDNPDIVVTGALTRAGSDRVPHLLAALTGTWPGDAGTESGHLVAVSAFVEGGEDAWALFRDHAIATLAGESQPAPDAAALGEAVGHVHADLAATMGTREASAEDAAALAADLVRRLAWARAAAADVLAPLTARLDAHAAALERLGALGALQHIHGDLHLGQVLRHPVDGFLLLDFEGEPLRPMHERLRREPRERDVVGMLRSFDYAAGFAQLARGGDDAAAAAWTNARQRAFLDGYGRVAGPIDEDGGVFRALLIDKALYEVVYEVRNRPEWLPVPLRAVEALLPA